MSADLKKGVGLYKGFRERNPERARRVNFSVPKVLTVIGPVDFIGYSTSHGEKAVAYKHSFAKGSKPLMCADPKTGKVFLIGGRYRFTSRGIVDLDSNRREIE